MSLFTGAGGFDRGMENAGIETVMQCDLFDASHLTELDDLERRALTAYGRNLEGVLSRHWPAVERVNDVRNVGVRPPADHVEGEPLAAKRPRADAERGRTGDGLHDPRHGQDGLGGDSDRRGGLGPHEGAGLTGEQFYDGGIDLVYGGSPCQDVSVAGKRAGLGGARSGLFFEFVRVVRELRPRWVVFENVFGLLSSNQGRDFGVVLDEMGQCGFGGLAWAVLDAQHFGVPQRRRRVFVVAGPSRRGVEQVLSLCESCGGNPETGRAQGEGTTGALSAGTLRAGGVNGGNNPAGGYLGDVAYALNASVRHTGDGHGNAWNSNYIANPLPGHHPRADLDNDTYVTASAVTASAGHHGHSSPRGDGSDNLVPMEIRTAQTGSNGWGVGTDEQAYTLDGAQGQAVLAGTLQSEMYHHGGIPNQTTNGNNGLLQASQMGVRRLTPLECERLMGWPDEHTRWTADGREVSDSHRYRMCGNGVVAPVAEWIGHRLVAVDALLELRGGCEAQYGANYATDYEIWECELPRGHEGAHRHTDNEWTDASTSVAPVGRAIPAEGETPNG